MNDRNGSYVFFGTPLFAVWVLEALEAADGPLPSVVVTAPDKPAGRGLKISPTPVKVWAKARGIPVLQPEKLDADFISKLSAVGSKLFLVVAYGKILPAELLALPPCGTLNIHPSLLPKYRGPSPIEAQILSGDGEYGTTLMLLDEETDHGPVVAQERVRAPRVVGKMTLAKRLAEASGAMLADILPKWIAGEIRAAPQDHRKATFTKKTKKEDGELDLEADGRENYLKYLAYEGWPGTYFYAERGGKETRVKIVKASLSDTGAFVVERVIPEGKKETSYRDWYTTRTP